MRIRDLASLAFTIIGVLAFLATFAGIHTLVTIPFYRDQLEGNAIAYAVVLGIPTVILAAAGVLLIRRRNTLAQALFPASESGDSAVTFAELQDLAYSLLGLYLGLSTLPDLGSLAGSLINLRAMESTHEFAGAFRFSVPSYIGTLLQLIAGGYLFLHGNRIGGFLRRLHRASEVPAQPPQPLPECPSCGKPYDPTQYRSDAAEHLCSGCRQPLPRQSGCA